MIYTNLDVVDQSYHGIAEANLMHATLGGRLYDVVVDSTDVDNGVALKLGEFAGNGLQIHKATVAQAGDKIILSYTVPVVKDAHTQAQAQPFNFYNKKGAVIRAYDVEAEYLDTFSVASYQFTSDKTPAVGDYVVVNGNGMWKATDADPTSTNGFVGKIIELSVGTYVTMVRIETQQNKQL